MTNAHLIPGDESQLGPHVPFRTPVPVPERGYRDGTRFSMCITGEWLALVIGAAETLLHTDTWNDETGDVLWAVEQATRMLADFVECGDVLMDCCEEILAKLEDILTAIRNLMGATNVQKRDDILHIVVELGNTTEVTDLHPSAPDVSFTEATGDVLADLEIREAALCAVVATLVHKVRNGYFEWAKELYSVAAGVAAALPVYGWIASLVIIGGGVIASVVDDLVFTTEEIADELACCLTTQLGARQPSQAEFLDAIDQCDLGFPYHTMALMVRQEISNPETFGAFIHDLGLAYDAIQAGAEYACPCDQTGDPCDVQGTLIGVDLNLDGSNNLIVDGTDGGCAGFGTIVTDGATFTPGGNFCLHQWVLRRFYGGETTNEALVCRVSVNGASWQAPIASGDVIVDIEPHQHIDPTTPVRVDLLGAGERMCMTGMRFTGVQGV